MQRKINFKGNYYKERNQYKANKYMKETITKRETKATEKYILKNQHKDRNQYNVVNRKLIKSD